MVRSKAARWCARVELDSDAEHGVLQHALHGAGEHVVSVDASHVLPDARKSAALDPAVHVGVHPGVAGDLYSAPRHTR